MKPEGVEKMNDRKRQSSRSINYKENGSGKVGAGLRKQRPVGILLDCAGNSRVFRSKLLAAAVEKTFTLLLFAKGSLALGDRQGVFGE